MARVHCPRCKKHRFWNLSDNRKRCASCRYTFKLKDKRFRKSSKYLNKLIEYFALGVPAYRLRFIIPLSASTIERIYRTIRMDIYRYSLQEMKKLSGELEMDETMFGGKKPGKRGWGALGKQIVFGIYQRNGKVLVFPVPNRSRKTLLYLVSKHTTPGSLYYTDDWHAYTTLSISGNHVIIQKEKGVSKGRNHINGIEGFWSYAKHWLHPYRGIPKQYFHLYLKEIEFRFNHRKENLIPLIKHIVKSTNINN